MAELVDPFDDPNFRPQPKAAPAAPEGLVDPFDSMTLQPTPPPQPAEEPGFLQRTFQDVSNFVTGNDRTEFEGLPEFIQLMDRIKISPAQRDALRNGMALSQDEGQQMDIIAKNLPGARFGQDSFGNPIVDYQGQKAYINKPGLSRQDIAGGVTTLTGGLLAAAPAGRAVQGAFLPARAAVTGAAVGGASAAQDLGAHALGAEKAVDLPRVATTAALGGAFEFAAPAVGWAYRQIIRRPELYNARTGTLTRAGREALQRAGIDPTQISDDFARQFARLGRDATDPNAAAAMAEAQSLPVGVPMTRGQVTGSPRQQMTENLMEKGAFGEPASVVMRGARDAQQEAIRANVPAIQSRIGGGQVAEPGQGAAQAQTALVAQRQAEKAGVDAAYDAARTASAAAPKSTVLTGSRAIRSAVEADHELAGLTRTSQLLDNFDGIIAQAGDDIRSQVDIRKLFDWRKRATNARRGNEATEEGVALGKSIRAFDEWADDLVDRALLQGDEQAVNLWKDAIAKNRAFAGKFKGGDLIEALTETESRGGARVLKVAPEDAANYVFTASKTGFLNKKNLARDLVRLRDQLGKNSPEWNALREEAFLRFARQGEGAFEGGERGFSGVNFKKAWDNALMNNAPLMRVLFSDGERNLISQFARVAAKATNPAKGGDNFSNTAVAQSNIIQRFADLVFLGPKGRSLLAAVPLLEGPVAAGQAARAFAATRGGVPKRTVSPGLVGATGATVADP